MKQINSMIRNDDVHASRALALTMQGEREQTTIPKCNTFYKKMSTFSLEFGYFIWNPYDEKCIQKSPNMPGIGSLIRKIDVNISEI